MHRRDFLQQGALTALAVAGALRAAEKSALVRPLRVAQLGTAHAHATEKWATLRRNPETFECVALCEPDAEQRGRAAASPEYRGAPWVEERELFARSDVDAVFVEAELPDLLRHGRRVLDAGWHLHLDKPPGRDFAAFAALQAQALAARRVFQQGYMYRYHPAIRFCFEAAERGWLGRILAVQGEMGRAIPAARRPWLAEHYGGAMLFLGCHLLDLAVGLLGAPERVTLHRRRSFPARDAFSDHEVAVLEYRDALATVRSLLAEVGGGERRQFVVMGENATIEVLPLEPARVRVAFQNPPAGYRAGYQEVTLPAPRGRYDEQLLDFAGQVRGQPSVLPRFDAAHDRRVHEVLLRAVRA